MNNLSPYCGLVDARISTSDKYLPVLKSVVKGQFWSNPNYLDQSKYFDPGLNIF